jgi:hypothetical protein
VGSTAREIEQHIASERGKLDGDISELQHRVQNATDWRWQVKQRPLMALGAAMAGGLLAAVLTGRSSRRKTYSPAFSYADLYSERKQTRKSRDVMVGFALGLGMRGLAKYLQS